MVRTKRKGAPAPIAAGDAPTPVVPPKKKMAKGWVEVEPFDESVIDPRLRNSGHEDLPRTRPGNANKQPGMVDVTPSRPWKSSAEVGKEKSDRAEQSKKDDEELRNKRKAVAGLEDAMVIEEVARQASAAKPVCGPVIAKVPRPVAHTQDDKDGASTSRGTLTTAHSRWQRQLQNEPKNVKFH
ncbi:uncharacterized protein LACBIDRAFT_321383 [Laccaria bicolor S238N-H82]|uniref:Predicted protein n=1 Tax=Laccaria bicolor (strain S238N-H82 / ATCC MYA-4686) TaxID=486041 RepID=B0CQ03_LACBS|nr:uncharacterized protein LACBIDRAFT_321383 [Laccaria bicolor S238N-H82]EDR15505.1 predicted protein [Laccaria bicolor S238N-H82]|eukprot:XP_001873713.1 predicted protein [Laccaria bicolor S238N-H82]